MEDYDGPLEPLERETQSLEPEWTRTDELRALCVRYGVPYRAGRVQADGTVQYGDEMTTVTVADLRGKEAEVVFFEDDDKLWTCDALDPRGVVALALGSRALKAYDKARRERAKNLTARRRGGERSERA